MTSRPLDRPIRPLYGSQAALLMGEYNAARKKLLDTPQAEKTRKGFTPTEIAMAYSALMTGPRAQRPTWRAVRKAIVRVRHGGMIKGSWRGWPRIKESA
jgi:hypothetical protein